jgi:hypothetical protein
MTSTVSVTGYDQLKTTLGNYGKDQRIFILFSGAKDNEGHSW